MTIYPRQGTDYTHPDILRAAWNAGVDFIADGSTNRIINLKSARKDGYRLLHARYSHGEKVAIIHIDLGE